MIRKCSKGRHTDCDSEVCQHLAAVWDDRGPAGCLPERVLQYSLVAKDQRSKATRLERTRQCSNQQRGVMLSMIRLWLSHAVGATDCRAFTESQGPLGRRTGIELELFNSLRGPFGPFLTNFCLVTPQSVYGR